MLESCSPWRIAVDNVCCVTQTRNFLIPFLLPLFAKFFALGCFYISQIHSNRKPAEFRECCKACVKRAETVLKILKSLVWKFTYLSFGPALTKIKF